LTRSTPHPTVITFIGLIIPLPFTWRRALFKTIAESQIIAKAQYALKITFIFVTLLFVDAVSSLLLAVADARLSSDAR
jgi:B-cell receptor-associated protein 31